MTGQIVQELLVAYTDAVETINYIKSKFMGDTPLGEPRPQLTTHLSNDVNRWWEIIDGIEKHLALFKPNNTSQIEDLIKATKWFYHGGQEEFELRMTDINNAIAIYVPGTPEEISRIKNDARMTFVVLTKRHRLIEGLVVFREIRNRQRWLDQNPQGATKSQLELREEEMRARDAKEITNLHHTLLRGLKILINSVISVQDPYKSKWNLEGLDIKGQLEVCQRILFTRSTGLLKMYEIEEEVSTELKQSISRTLILMLIHVDYLLIEISDPSMYQDTITDYTRSRKSWNYLCKMDNIYAEESASYYTAWEPQFSRRIDSIAMGIRALIAGLVLDMEKSLLGKS
ncbi:hypothetical protein BOTCAL_0234g00130 [Botryotinia calthae]|uniref:Uncharacterized protein n=1 Tax=Botryotinia calthae TaxID=38488 RepID=A0A4Y8CXI9_9HELO|nr:hypothetical protein BOTCAL_0234g00130 [Botryotinia calthae]